MNNTVRCNNGSFIGDESEDLIVWRGIPYATQPVGELRWKKALPAADDDGTYEAIGKVANASVYTRDFIHYDNAEEIMQVQLFATIVDGKEVYKA